MHTRATTTTKAIRIHERGGPEVLRWESVDLEPPRVGEARVKHTAIGLNYVDTYHRTGLYPGELPEILGTEAAGIVEALGGWDRSNNTGIAVGDRVAYARGPLGSYAEARNIPSDVLVKLPDTIDDRTAAAVMLKGMTAHYLLEIGGLVFAEERVKTEVTKASAMTRKTKRGTHRTILVHAAAGGVGLLLTQWAKHLGAATIIGTVGSEEKAALARENGCDHVILYRTEKVSTKVREIVRGGVDVVYDSVGKDTFLESIASLRPRGLMVSFGQSSGSVPPFEPRLLSQNGSLFFTRPTLHDYVRRREDLEWRARDLFDALERKIVSVRIAQTYQLEEAETAHRDLEARKTTGSTLLLP